MNDRAVNLLCVKVIMNLSAEVHTYQAKLLEMKVIKILLEQARSAAGGVDFKRVCAAALCNLSFYPTMRIPMSEPGDAEVPIVAGVRAIIVCDEEAVYEQCAMIMLNLAMVEEARENMLTDMPGGEGKQAAVAVTVAIGENGNVSARQVAVMTLCHLSNSKGSFSPITSTALPFLCKIMKSSTEPKLVRLDAARTVANICAFFPGARKACINERIVPALEILSKTLKDDDEHAIVASIIRNMTSDAEIIFHVIEGGCMITLTRMAKLEDARIKHDVATSLVNLCLCKFESVVVEDGALECCFWLTISDCLNLTTPIYLETSTAVRLLCAHSKLAGQVALEEKLFSVLERLAAYGDSLAVQKNAATSFYSVLGFENARKSMVQKGAIETIVKLASVDKSVKEICSSALHELPSDFLSNIDAKSLEVLMALLQITDSAFLDPASFMPDRKMASKSRWVLTTPQYEVSELSIPSEWPTIVVERRVTSFVPARDSPVELVPEDVDPELTGSGTKAVQIGVFHVMKFEVDRVTHDDLKAPMSIDQDDVSLVLSLGKEESGDDGGDDQTLH
eukprot:CAMPEP_0185747802 /NCGR_PEP_ID=MMETSP1174-20130828/6439_1 /TAXON_ID=35687 /ORGANISM="Dictyocha speculum, Strain CCMP1381" /LENGTH=564 /DNA_ID=CAMNT_0028423149 /DNA_START=165 /DNA_END=1856 /DNA_ORIENTATION=-